MAHALENESNQDLETALRIIRKTQPSHEAISKLEDGLTIERLAGMYHTEVQIERVLTERTRKAERGGE